MPDYNYFTHHPLRVPKDQTSTTVDAIATACAEYTNGQNMIHPSAGAYIHYGGVELADKLALQKPEMTDYKYTLLCNHWENSCGRVTKTLLHYLWRICLKEIRHGAPEHIKNAFGSDWLNNPAACALNSVSTQGNYMTAILNHKNLDLGTLYNGVCQHYYKGGWGGAFGGKAWGNIADQFNNYIKGDLSAMLAADRCWTLVHNTGPIFNKGFFFSKHDGNLMKVLNCQAETSVFDMDNIFMKENTHYSYMDELMHFKQFKIMAEEHLGEAPVTSTTNTKQELSSTQIGPVIFKMVKEKSHV